MLASSEVGTGKGAYTGCQGRLSSAGPEVVLRSRGVARLRAGHPWVYRSDVAAAAGEPGDVVRVVDGRGRFLGRGFYNPRSEISLRLAERGEIPIDRRWFARRIESAVAYRRSLRIGSDACRLLHAEADGVPGLVVDRYGGYLVVQAGSAAVEERLGWVVEALVGLLEPAGILARNDQAARKKEGLDTAPAVLYGAVPDRVVVREGPVRYRVDLWGGQKTGGFLDQRENHLAAGRYARGRVLDVFSYAGGFALHAALRADSVEAVDASEAALEAARDNAVLNGLENVTFTRANAFDLLRARSDGGERYDAVILDPPAFAKAKRELPRARRAYKEINLRAMKLLSPGGVLVTCSCSHHLSREAMEEVLRSAAADAGRTMRVREWRGQAADHPEILTVPETRYLKCAVLEAVN